MNGLILFPHQLFEASIAEAGDGYVVLVEHPLYFTQFPFHKQKLVLHRASMRAFAERLESYGARVLYVEVEQFVSLERIAGDMYDAGVRSVRVYDPVDDWLEREVREAFGDMCLSFLDTPMFLTSPDTLNRFFDSRGGYRLADFYAFQRQRLGILVDARGLPEGGRWSFDADNRKRLPRGTAIPIGPAFEPNSYTFEACRWVESSFGDNYGSVESFNYPVTHPGARARLRFFLDRCLHHFGPYEDAMVCDESALFHSVLTPALNIGLLTPAEVIRETLEFAQTRDVPLNSLEGFIRQVIGWREFVRAVYVRVGRKQRTANHFRFRRGISTPFWTGATGLLPADAVIGRLLDTGYTHHIERLMVLGNLMLLCEIDPGSVYSWFMTLYIDAYDWVMVPNVYGMSQFADGGLIVTKPYVCGSAYLRKMGDWPTGDWQKEWDGLYWRFVDRHRADLAGNARVGFAPLTFDRLSTEQQRAHHANANRVLARLFSPR